MLQAPTLVMLRANPVADEAIRDLGAEGGLVERDFDGALLHAQRLAGGRLPACGRAGRGAEPGTQPRVRGHRLAIICTGGNMSPAQLAEALATEDPPE